MNSRIIVIIALFLLAILNIQAQVKGLLGQLPEEEQSTLEAIALYPHDERTAILEASAHPEILVRLQNIRMQTETQFRDLLAPLPEEDQKKIYNFARYPELIADILEDGRQKTRAEMHALLHGYPGEIHDDAIFVNRRYFDLLTSTERLYTKSEDKFEAVLKRYPENVREAYRRLIMLPEIISILAENMSTTVLLGDIYTQNPVELIREMDSLNVVVAEEKARELSAWKEQLEEDPEAMYEYEQASREFAREQGYDDDVYDGPVPEKYTTDFYIHHVWRPYPYWFGWPWWYSFEVWYPYPWWYHWGYYYGPDRVIVFVGLPSSYFLHWHFNRYTHLYYYPRFTNQVFRYYYGPRRTSSSIHRVVRQWVREQPVLPHDWMQTEQNRVERIREYGKFQMDHSEAVANTRGIAPTTREFLKDHADKYPTLRPVLKDQPEAKPAPPRKEQLQPPVPRYEPKQYEPREKVIEPKRTTREEVERAKDHHRNTWEKARQKQPDQVNPPKRTPQKTQTTKTERTSPRKTNPEKN